MRGGKGGGAGGEGKGEDKLHCLRLSTAWIRKSVKDDGECNGGEGCEFIVLS